MSGQDERNQATMESWLAAWLLPDAQLCAPELAAEVAPPALAVTGGAR